MTEEGRLVKASLISRDTIERVHKVSKYISSVPLHEMKRQVEIYHKKIFSDFGDDAIWSEENEDCLKGMKRIKNAVKGQSSAEQVYSKVSRLVHDAEQYRKVKKQKDHVDKICHRITTGLNQDVLFERFHEYFSLVREIADNIEEDRELKKSKRVFDHMRRFLSECIGGIEEQKKVSEEELITMRLEHAEDLVYVSRQSPPKDEWERTKKLSALQEVLQKYLLPLRIEALTAHQEVFLERIINLYEQTIEELTA